MSDVEGLTTADLFPSQVFARYYDEIRPTLLRHGSWNGDVPVFTASGDLLPMTLTIVAQIGPFGEIAGSSPTAAKSNSRASRAGRALRP